MNKELAFGKAASSFCKMPQDAQPEMQQPGAEYDLAELHEHCLSVRQVDASKLCESAALENKAGIEASWFQSNQTCFRSSASSLPATRSKSNKMPQG